MSRTSSALAILALVGLASPLLAQDVRKAPPQSERIDGDRGKIPPPDAAKTPPEAPTFDDLKSSLGDLEKKESKEETEKRDAIIQKNYDDTLKIYGNALGKRNGDLVNVDRRLDVNKGLESKYERLLKGARNALAATRSQFINRTVALKKSLDEGKVSKEAYDKLLDEDTKRFRNREKELLDDIAFYQDEHQNAQRASKDLATKKELMAFDPFGGPDAVPDAEKPPKIGIAQKVRATLAEVSGYRVQSVVDTLR
ncbi:MAG TPA: hypothetical protein VKW04_17050 [Planctomycetota bacterium]|nr:hypothetical protein [Planctomycetota bacterium]